MLTPGLMFGSGWLIGWLGINGAFTQTWRYRDLEIMSYNHQTHNVRHNKYEWNINQISQFGITLIIIY